MNKDLFPVLFNDISYNGEVPDMKYFVNINQIDYANYIDKFIGKDWNFKDEAIKYCLIDCISLYEILFKFNQLIYNKFNDDPMLLLKDYFSNCKIVCWEI